MSLALERTYQRYLIEKIENILEGCTVLKNDSQYRQGIPDLIVLHGDRWAMLEVKVKKPTKPGDVSPNQKWYINTFNEMSYGSFIYPENEEEVLDELQHALAPRGTSRLSKRQ